MGWNSRQRKDVAALAGAIALLALAPAGIAHASKTPNDPGFSLQWSAENSGQAIPGQSLATEELGKSVNGTPFADTSATDAWSLTIGDPAIVIGEVDTGVDYEHPDLGANVWSNPGNVGKCSSVGEGCNSVEQKCEAGTRGFNVFAKSCVPLDEDKTYGGHGTHVAGIMGALGGNELGVAGINWRTTILPVKWLELGNEEPKNAAEQLAESLHAILEAKQAHVNVRVVNISAVFQGTPETKELRKELEALETAKILLVVAAGNNRVNQNEKKERTFPCGFGFANEICVTATNNRDELPSLANYGSQFVQLAAPGVSIYSTLRGEGSEANYGYLSGTSMAAAEVSGAAALILAAKPSLSVAELKADILENVDKVPALEGKVGTGGRLDVCKAIPGCSDGTGSPPPPPPPPKPPPPTPNPAPVLSGLKIAPSSFKAAKSGASISSARAKPGAIVNYTDSLPALTEFTVLVPRAGILNTAKKCVAPPRRRPAHGHRSKRCVRYLAGGTFKRTDAAGLNKFHFSGRIGKRKLARGRYRLQAVPVFGGVTGAAAIASFRIIS